MKKLVRFIGYLVLLLTIFLLIYSLLNKSVISIGASRVVLLYGLPAIFLASLFLDLFPQYFSAHSLIVIADLYNMTLFIVVLVILAGTFLASVIGFWLGKRFEEDIFEDLFGKKIYEKIDKGIDKHGKWYASVSAVSPLPYIPILFGAFNMKWKNFLLYGILPRLIGFVVTGVFVYYGHDFVVKFIGAI